MVAQFRQILVHVRSVCFPTWEIARIRMTQAKTSLKNSDALPSDAELKELYRMMLLIRRFEEKAGQLYGMGLIGGFCHLYIGQEAVVTGIQSVQTEADSVVTAYRDHGHMLACGMEARGVMAELTGREGGYSRGKGGSMHMFSVEKKFFGGHGIVGASTSIGTGLGFAHKYRKDGGVAVAYMGDGAANQGQVYECYNMASLWKLPILYVIENNKYGMGTSQKRHAAGELGKRGDGFAIPNERVDGMDVLAVQRAASAAFDHIRAGHGPYILEMDTYRYRGHSMSDPGKYRERDEIEKMREQRDPIETLRALIGKQTKIKDSELEQIDEKIKEIVADAAAFSQESPELGPDELWTDILLPLDEKAA